MFMTVSLMIDLDASATLTHIESQIEEEERVIRSAQQAIQQIEEQRETCPR
jgi:hypothetical protein